MKERENFHLKSDKGLSCLMSLWWLKSTLWLVDLTYNFESDWLIELSDNKLSNNNLASKLVENRSFLKPITIKEIVIFMINTVIHHNDYC